MDARREAGLYRSATWHEEAPTVLRGLLGRPDWHADAACRDMDPALFFPGRGEATHEAKEACRGCPVAEQCLAAGMREHVGVWGGTTERQRRRMRARRAAA